MVVTTAYGIHKVVTHGAAKLGLSKPLAWSGFATSAFAALYWASSSPARRSRITEAFGPVLAAIGEAYARAASAENALKSSRLLTPRDPDRLEVRVATYLVLKPDKNMGEIAEHLELVSHERPKLSSLLKSHPGFELAGRYGWAVGKTRDMLETEPSKNWRPTQPPLSPA